MAKPMGWLARLPDEGALSAAVQQLRAQGWTRLQVFSPYPIEGLAEALGHRSRWSGPVILLVALGAAGAAFAIQWYSAVIDYPFVVGGKPFGHWAPFALVTFAMGLLGTVLAAIIGMLAGNHLPQPYHPAFNVPDFADASGDGFFLLLAADDPQAGDEPAVHQALEAAGARIVAEVPA